MKPIEMDFIPRKSLELYYHFGVYTKSGKYPMEWLCNNVIPKLHARIPLLSISKSMVDDCENKGNLISYPKYILRFTDKELKIYAVGGPCTSYELVDKAPTAVTFCGPDMKTLRWLRELFATDYYHISLSTEVRGVECTVALKNAYALGVLKQ